MEFPESLLDFSHHDPLLIYVFLYDICISAPSLTYHNQIKIWPLQRSQMNPPLLGHIVPGAACFLVLYSLAMSYHRSDMTLQLASWSPHCYSYLAKESGPCRLLSSSTGWSVATWGVTSAEYSQKVTGYCIRCLCTAASTISASSKPVLLVLQCHDHGIGLCAFVVVVVAVFKREIYLTSFI